MKEIISARIVSKGASVFTNLGSTNVPGAPPHVITLDAVAAIYGSLSLFSMVGCIVYT